jgi:PKD repeat protein
VVGRSEGSFTLDGAPLASFYAQPELGDVPLSVDFTDTSAGVVASWLWDFGDGITTTVQHPTHVFTRSAAYTVTLAVSGPVGGDAFTRTNAITVTVPPLAAAFDARPLLGTPPLTVTFTDRSTGPPIEGWNWAFGDGVTSTLPQPVHVYTQVGAYTVTLVVTADEQVTSLARPRYVVVAERLSQVLLPVVLRGDAPQHAGALQLSAPGSGPPSLEVDP